MTAQKFFHSSNCLSFAKDEQNQIVEKLLSDKYEVTIESKDPHLPLTLPPNNVPIRA